MLDKRGSHVGMIISFTLFITFITFIYTIINPVVNTGEDKEALLEYVEDKILENISSNLSIISLTINEASNPGTTCIELEKFFTLSASTPNSGILVKDEDNQIQTPYYNEEYLDDIKVNRANSDITFLKFYISNRFDNAQDTSPECTAIDEDGYNISLVSKLNYIFEEDLNNLVEYYNNESDKFYQDLKNRFVIPNSTDFAVSFRLSNGEELVAEKEIPSKVNVYVKETPMLYVNGNADVMSGFIKIKIW